MIYGHSALVEESHKERNLYTKVFAGCIFNELLPRYPDLTLDFLNLLLRCYVRTCKEFRLTEEQRPRQIVSLLIRDVLASELHLDFDHHAYQLGAASNRGELADVFISGSRAFVSIECKYTKDWDLESDIKLMRTRAYESPVGQLSWMQVLLVAKSKWCTVRKQKSRGASNYQALDDYLQTAEAKQVPFVVMFWDDLSEMVEIYPELSIVKDFVDQMLKKV